MDRVNMLLGHLVSASPAAPPLQMAPCAAGDSAAYPRSGVRPDDVVIVSALRTPLCKAGRGGLKDTHADDLLATVLRATLHRTGIPPADVGDIVVGSVLGNSSLRATECRIAAFYAGFPETVPCRTTNRQCSSGLQAVADVAASIRAGYYAIGIGAGVESMSTNPMAWEGSVNPKVAQSPATAACMMPMGITSENVAARYGISRAVQDAMAVRSHQRAAAARAAGRFKDEIVPVETVLKDAKTGDSKRVTISEDDGIRPDVTPADLAKLKPVFKADGSTTAGNASQMTDGAAAVLLMRRDEADRRGLPTLAVFRSFTAVGVDPAVMGVGPAVAIPAAAALAGLAVADVDLFELNEAFASQATYCITKLGLDGANVNPNGGAMALGHPLGATGARCVATLLHEMIRRGPDCRYGCVSMCIGAGMGAAAIFERGSVVGPTVNARSAQAQGFLSRDAMA